MEVTIYGVRKIINEKYNNGSFHLLNNLEISFNLSKNLRHTATWQTDI
jgi:hypothetical protein